ncbi:MAG: hypothetical protein H6Q48_4244 [Deltaproteobacteria bacterium]|jgi:hypothetical protein|nr:hypothetical protein [Deltaproteobacteria bacterium]
MAEKKRQERGGFVVLDFLKSAFEDLTAQDSGEKWILTPCTVNGEKSAAIPLIKEKSRSMDIVPIFVAVTPNMVLLDSKGVWPLNLRNARTAWRLTSALAESERMIIDCYIREIQGTREEAGIGYNNLLNLSSFT